MTAWQRQRDRQRQLAQEAGVAPELYDAARHVLLAIVLCAAGIAWIVLWS